MARDVLEHFECALKGRGRVMAVSGATVKEIHA
jgi:hypothetical protein